MPMTLTWQRATVATIAFIVILTLIVGGKETLNHLLHVKHVHEAALQEKLKQQLAAGDSASAVSWETVLYDPVPQFNPFAKARGTSRAPIGESKGEKECRRVLETLFQKKFSKHRPDFLINPVTNNEFSLELDCYNEEIGLAVEYNGRQHYDYVPHFHKNRDQFTTQKYRDDLKRRLCRENQVCLIEVPYTVKHADIATYLVTQLKEAGIL